MSSQPGGARRTRAGQQAQNDAQAQQALLAQPRALAQLDDISRRIMRLPDIEQKIAFQQRSGANLLIRVARTNGDPKTYFEDYLGQIVGGDYTKPGNLDWPLVKAWVVEHINRAINPRQGFRVGDDVGVNLFLLNVWDQGRDEQRELIDKVAFIRLLIRWEKGEIALPATEDGHEIFIEFESTKLENGIRPSVELPGVPGEDELDEPVENPIIWPRRRRTRRSPRYSSSSSSSAGPGGRNYHSITSDSLSSGSGRDFGPGPDGPLRLGLVDEEQEEEGGDGAGRRNKGKAPAELPPSPDEEAEEAEENNELLNELENGLPGDGVNLKAESKEHWEKVLAFFKIYDKKTMQFTLPGLNYPIEGYQAAAIVWLLLRIPEDAVAGAMLADAMGLGKTFTIIATLVSHYYLHDAYEEVKASWTAREKSPSNKSPQHDLAMKHNQRHPHNKRRCPSQNEITQKYGIECPCVLNSASKAIVQSMEDLPSIIICPSAGATVWLSEWEKFVSTEEGTAAAQMKLYLRLTDYRGDKPNFNAFCHDMAYAQHDDVRSSLDVDDDGVLFKPSLGFKGGSANVLLMTRESVSRMQGSQDPYAAGAFFTDADVLEPVEAAGMQDVDKIAQVPIAGCGIFAMDEMHQYHGQSGRNGATHPFQLLYKFKYQENPTLAVGISGNTMSIGPEGWQHLVAHTRESIRRHPHLTGKAQLGRLQDEEEYGAMKKDWDKVLSKIGNGNPDDPANAALEQCKRRIHADFQKGIRKMIVRRAKNDSFKEVKVLNIAAAVTTPMALRIPEGPALADLGRNVLQIQQWVRNQYEQDMQNWNAGGRQGPEPQSVSARTQNGVLQQNGIGSKGHGAQRSRRAFHSSVRAMTFPEVARIGSAAGTEHLEKFVKANDNSKAGEETKSLADLATNFTNVTLNPLRNSRSVLRMMRQSPFWKYRTAFTRTSPKFKALCRLVQEQLLDTRSITEPPEGPPDGSGLRHMVVFTDSPLSAYLTALFLQGQFNDTVDVTLIHQALDDRTSSTKTPWKCRFKACELFNAPCKPEDHKNNKVLVGTYRLISTMINFQRASSAVLMDVPTTVQGQQARDRIHRRGQPLTAQITEMHYENHIYEVTRWKKNQGQKLMEEIDWQGFQSANNQGAEADADAAMDEDPDEEEEEEEIYD